MGEDFKAELTRIELSISQDWIKINPDIYALFIYFLYIRILPSINPLKAKKVYDKNNTNNEKNDEYNLDNYLQNFFNEDVEQSCNNIDQSIKTLSIINSFSFGDLFKVKTNENVTIPKDGDEFSNLETQDKVNELNREVEQNKQTFSTLTRFISKLDTSFSEIELKFGFYEFIKESFTRNSFVKTNINIKWEVFEKLKLILPTDLESIFILGKTNHINLVELLNNGYKFNIILDKERIPDLYFQILFSLFNYKYEFGSYTKSIPIILWDLTNITDAETLGITKLFSKYSSQLQGEVSSKLYLLFDKSNPYNQDIVEFIHSICRNNLLRTILYSSNNEITIFEVFSEYSLNEQKKINIVDYTLFPNQLKIIKSFYDYSNTTKNVSIIQNNLLLSRQINISNLFFLSRSYRLGKISKLIIGESLANLKIRRGEQNKEIITSDDGIPLVVKKDLVEAQYDDIEPIKLTRIDNKQLQTDATVSKKSIIFCFHNNEILFKIFNPIGGYEKILLDHEVFGLEIHENEITIEQVFGYLSSAFSVESLWNKKNTNSTYQNLEQILDINVVISNEVIEKHKMELDLQLQKNILNSFRHNTRSKISRIIQNVEEIESLIKRNNLSNELLFLAPDLNKPGEEVGTTVLKTLKELNHVSKYLEQTKKLYSEIDYNNFKKIDLVKILSDIKELRREDKFRLQIPTEFNKYFLNAHEDYIVFIITELLDNANLYAFDKEASENVVSIKFEYKQGNLVMSYSNNGKDFELTKSEYIQFGKTSNKDKGTGYGGAMIDKYVKAHNGDLFVKKGNGMNLEFHFNIREKQYVY